jgi:hypothetical protein
MSTQVFNKLHFLSLPPFNQVMFYDDEEKCIVVSKTGVAPDLKARAVSRTFPAGDTNFEFEFPYKQFKCIILTSDNQVKILFAFGLSASSKAFGISFADRKGGGVGK